MYSQKELLRRRRENDLTLLNKEKQDIEELLRHFLGKKRNEIYANFNFYKRIAVNTSHKYKKANNNEKSSIEEFARKIVSSYYKYGKEFTYKIMEDAKCL